MKNKTLGIFLIIGFTISTVASVSYHNSNKSTAELSDFEITVQKTEDGIKLTCSKGCAWKELSYEKPAPDHIQKIDEFGMVTATSNE